jgi:hypothetical protein
MGTDAADAAGGSAGTGGAVVTGGTLGTGGIGGTGGAAGSGGTTRTAGPCDIYDTGYTPCVAAHSTVRALFAAYQGPLYQVRKGDSTKDIPVGADGFVDVSTQDAFCAGGTCTISILYDQSRYHNDLTKSPTAEWLPNGGNEANATAAKIMVGGHTAYGILVDNPTTDVAYRNNRARGLATGDQSEAMYMVVDGKRYSHWCCFDYGNATTSGREDGQGTTEAVYFGAAASFSGGGGDGPWVAADLGLGIWEGDTPLTTSNTPVSFSYVTAMLKGPAGNRFVLKAGNAQSSPLETKWDGPRPSGYSPMKKEGAIVLGTSSDGSNSGIGIFFEGSITSGNPTDATDDAIQANIVAAGYGR